jgi:hypothetical protein
LVCQSKLWTLSNSMKVGDLVILKDTYPTWMFSVGLNKRSLGLVTDTFELTDEVEVYWFSLYKSYTIKQSLLLKVQSNE